MSETVVICSSLMSAGRSRTALGEFTTVSAAGGMSHLDDQLRTFRGRDHTYAASISHTAERAVFGASYERSFVPSFGFGGTTRNQQMIGWINLPPIGRRLYLQGSTSWRRSNPLEIPMSGVSTPSRSAQPLATPCHDRSGSRACTLHSPGFDRQARCR